MKYIYLVRHAESYQNIGQTQFKEEALRLTDLGVKQSVELVSHLEKPSLVVVSKYLRAILTAEPLFSKYTEPKIEIWRGIHEFNYLSFSSSSRTDDSFKQREEDYWNLLDPNYRDGDGVETFAEFVMRVSDSFSQIDKLEVEGNVYIFTHHDFIRLFLIMVNYKSQFEKENEITLVKSIMKEYKNNSSGFLAKNCGVFDVSNYFN